MVTAKARQLPGQISDWRGAGAWHLPEVVPILTRKISTILGVLAAAMTGRPSDPRSSNPLRPQPGLPPLTQSQCGASLLMRPSEIAGCSFSAREQHASQALLVQSRAVYLSICQGSLQIKVKLASPLADAARVAALLGKSSHSVNLIRRVEGAVHQLSLDWFLKILGRSGYIII